LLALLLLLLLEQSSTVHPSSSCTTLRFLLPPHTGHDAGECQNAYKQVGCTEQNQPVQPMRMPLEPLYLAALAILLFSSSFLHSRLTKTSSFLPPPSNNIIKIQLDDGIKRHFGDDGENRQRNDDDSGTVRYGVDTAIKRPDSQRCPRDARLLSPTPPPTSRPRNNACILRYCMLPPCSDQYSRKTMDTRHNAQK